MKKEQSESSSNSPKLHGHHGLHGLHGYCGTPEEIKKLKEIEQAYREGRKNQQETFAEIDAVIRLGFLKSPNAERKVEVPVSSNTPSFGSK